jgi:lysophospholipase L1-like esterase
MPHVVLLGDSTFDNAAYVAGGPDVPTQLRAQLPDGWRVSLAAVDGDRTQDVAPQLQRLPPDTSHLIVSVGGNDALDNLDFLAAPAASVASALEGLAGIAEGFERAYHRMLQAVMESRLPTAFCTIYYPQFPDPVLQRLAVTALTVFNDVIVRAAFGAGAPLLDLRLICNADVDYANPIEPSVVGGEKIARAIATLVQEHDFVKGRTEVFV